MKTIKRIVLENFQSHTKTILEPATNGQMTVIVGPTDSGKTAIIRALRWVFYNIPQGIDFIRIGAKFAKVTIAYDNGSEVTRLRSIGGVNRYTVTVPGEKPQDYEGFGTTVPIVVQEATGVRLVSIGDLSLNLNLAEQLDGPFLGSKHVSAPARAKVMGKLAGTEEVDYAAKGLAADIYHRRQEVKRLSDEIESLETKITEDYAYLEGLGEAVRQVEVLLAEVRDAEARRKVLASLLEKRNVVVSALDNIIINLNMLGFIEQVRPIVTGLEKTDYGLGRLIGWSELRVDNSQRLNKAKSVLESTKDIYEAAKFIGGSEADNETLAVAEQLQAQRTRAVAGLEDAKDKLTLCQGVPEAVKVVGQAVEGCMTLVRLQALSDRKSKLQAQQRKVEDVLGVTCSIHEGYDIIREAEPEAIRLLKLSALAVGRGNLLNSVTKTEKRIQTLGDDAKNLRSEYMKTLSESGRCRFCGSQVSEENLKEVI
ncbi:MAG: AAA family ATPase [Thermincolia bacterium]